VAWSWLHGIGRRPFVVPGLLAATAGATFALASPPFDFIPALWLGMAAYEWVLSEDARWPEPPSRVRVAMTGAWRGLAFGMGANVLALRFIPAVVTRFTPLPWMAGFVGLLLLAAFEGARWMVAGVACETLTRVRVPRPVAFAAGVYAGSFVPTMLPWTAAGGASPWPAVVQLADVVGERGVSALMALAAALAAVGVRLIVRRRQRRRGSLLVGAAVGLVAAQFAYGVARMRAIDDARPARRVRVGLLQPSIAASTRWEEDRAPLLLSGLSALTMRAAEQAPDLVVWPEASYPYRLPHGARRAPGGPRAIPPAGVRVPVLAGLLLAGGPDGRAYNSAVVAYPGGELSDSYDKRHLLWFGETVPLADRLPWLRRVFARGLGLAQGDAAARPLTAGAIRAAVLICYEDTLPEAGREAMLLGPNLLVNITNDAWFHESAESELHLRLAALRAVELRRDLVRAVNRGPTSWIDAAGRVRARLPAAFADVALVEPALIDSPPTLYARMGDTPWALALLIFANAAVWRAVRRGE
jgi:apolipoprotein N-acyltransferase